MQASGPVYNPLDGTFKLERIVDWLSTMGLPITEAYWAKVKVGGVERDVLIQAFERRVLTYTPDNPAGFKVEMGNVGLHYATWRYGYLSMLTVTSPGPNEVIKTPQILIQGYTTNRAAQVRVDDVDAELDPNGNFSVNVDWLVPGINEIEVSAQTGQDREVIIVKVNYESSQ